MPTDEKIIKRRLPAKEKAISDINSDRDVRVRILGTIIGITEESLMVDDGTSRTEVVFDDPRNLDGLKEGQFIRVISRILPLIDGFECRGEVVQKLDGLDIGLYKKAKEIVGG
jgi:hypothetical protein